MIPRGGLRSETAALTKATSAVQRDDADIGAATPPPSPQSSALLSALGVDFDRDENAEEGSDSPYDDQEEEEEEEEEFLPGVYGSKRPRKRPPRRRLQQPTTPKRRRRTPPPSPPAPPRQLTTAEEGEEEHGLPAEDGARFKADRRGRGAQNWVDDGCMATFTRRLEAFRRFLDETVRTGRVSFYNNPRPPAHVEEEEEEGDEAEEDEDDGGFHDEAAGPIVKDQDADDGTDAEDTNTRYRYYGPGDVLVTDAGLSIPTYMYAHLFPHQRECLEWLHHLHERNTGGILGDDMGLGKTVQIAAFLGAMHHARRLRTALLLCPASVLLQWVRELHKWYPWLRVVLLHSSGTGATRAGRAPTELIDEVTQFDEEDSVNGGGGGIIITTYEYVRQYQEPFLEVEWDYAILDEGHRIRNPDAEITLVCKQLKTVHRIILTGTPIQNRLKELWSLFDFVYPGKLGTLPTFEDEFVLPIRTGGYANASKMQVLMAYKCALALKEVINPFMLRRTKKEIQHVTKMPEKMEQILFCHLTPRQYEAYEMFLASPEVAAVLRQEIRPFRAISILRHICNHPDLLSTVGEYKGTDFRFAQRPAGESYGSPGASGKMMVLVKILALWNQQGHRVLLFTQTRKMLDILESLMSTEGYLYCRLDGTTSVKERQSLLDAFNQEGSSIFIFLLTTRAGGIGVNLTGADRVVIFDPDWNPSTDLQARERSWRLGQTKQVTIYRLITSGTIEEKIYHRQIFKQYLTSKVLHDAKRKRCFNKHTLRDLFVLGDQRRDSGVETTELFMEGQVVKPDAGEEDLEEGEEVEESKPDSAEDDEQTDEDGSSGGGTTAGGDNDAILKQLFDGDQVRGVFNHDVVESDGVQNQEADLIEMESTKIAESALSALRASCALVRQQRETLFSPTWTGRSGSAGDPNQRAPPRFGSRVARGRGGRGIINGGRGRGNSPSNPFAQSTVSSRDMLQRLKNRKHGVSTPSPVIQSSKPHLNSNGFMGVNEMTKQLHAFLVSRSSGPRQQAGVTTEELLDAFGSVVAPKDKLVFRNLLRDMAVCKGRRWQLKPEYSTGGDS